jgi:hypothetical protein
MQFTEQFCFLPIRQRTSFAQQKSNLPVRFEFDFHKMVAVTGFEPATSWL